MDKETRTAMLEDLIEAVRKHKISDIAVCYFLGITMTTWTRWKRKECFANQYDRIMKVHDFIQNTEKYIKSA